MDWAQTTEQEPRFCHRFYWRLLSFKKNCLQLCDDTRPDRVLSFCNIQRSKTGIIRVPSTDLSKLTRQAPCSLIRVQKVRSHTHTQLCAGWHNVKAEFRSGHISMWLFDHKAFNNNYNHRLKTITIFELVVFQLASVQRTENN